MAHFDSVPRCSMRALVAHRARVCHLCSNATSALTPPPDASRSPSVPVPAAHPLQAGPKILRARLQGRAPTQRSAPLSLVPIPLS